MTDNARRMRLIDDLRALLGPGAVLTGPGETEGYRSDLSACPATSPLCVVRPHSTEEVAALVRLCAGAGAVIVPRGGGSGLSGGAAVLSGSADVVVVSMERMRAIRALDRVGQTMVVEAGCVLAEARRVAETANMRLCIDHGGAGSSQIGGTAATNSGGNNVLRYGMARGQILGLEAVLADGCILDALKLLPKNNAGYDLKQLLVGSEGTLGLITAVALRLHPSVMRRATALFPVKSPAAALALFALARRDLAETLSAFELLPQSGIDIQRQPNRILQSLNEPAEWYVLLEAETTSRHIPVETAMEAFFAAALEKGLAHDGLLALSLEQRDALWQVREGIAHAMIETAGSLKSDTAVPLRAIPDFIEKAGTAVRAILPDCRPIPFGHVGDGNIHFNVLPPEDMPADVFRTHHAALAAAIEDAALAFDGTVSAEHGIGCLKSSSLERMCSPVQIRLMRGIKAAFDPESRFNPGKILS